MNAKEARELAESISREEAQKEIKNIFPEIEKAAMSGNFDCTYWRSISPAVKAYFLRLGYKIEQKDGGRNENYYKITW